MQWPVSTRRFPVHIDAPFGGPDGSRLSLLNKVTVYMNMAFAFHGIAFSYDDGTELLCGSKSNIHHSKQMKEGIAQSVTIHGRLGERIVKMSFASELRRSEGSSFMRVLEVCIRIPSPSLLVSVFWFVLVLTPLGRDKLRP